MILTANGFAIVKYNGLFSIFALLALPAASEALNGPSCPSNKTMFPRHLPLRLSSPTLLFILGLFIGLLLDTLPLTCGDFQVYNFFQQFIIFSPFSPDLPIHSKHQIFFYFLKISKSIRSIASIANTNFKSPAVPLDLEALQTQFVQNWTCFPFYIFVAPHSPTPGLTALSTVTGQIGCEDFFSGYKDFFAIGMPCTSSPKCSHGYLLLTLYGCQEAILTTWQKQYRSGPQSPL